MQLHLNAFGDRPRIKYADTMRYKLQECYQMHVECISCAHMRSECAVLPTVRMHSMRGGIKKLTYHGGELGRFKITSLDAKWTPPVFLWGADDNEWEPDSLKGGTWVGEPVGGDDTNVAEAKATVASALAPAAKVWSEILAMENEKEGAGVKFIVDHRSITARSLKKIVVDHAPAGTSTNQAGAVKWLLGLNLE